MVEKEVVVTWGLKDESAFGDERSEGQRRGTACTTRPRPSPVDSANWLPVPMPLCSEVNSEPNELVLAAWRRGFCRRIAESSVEPLRSRPEMKWKFLDIGKRRTDQREYRSDNLADPDARRAAEAWSRRIKWLTRTTGQIPASLRTSPDSPGGFTLRGVS